MVRNSLSLCSYCLLYLVFMLLVFSVGPCGLWEVHSTLLALPLYFFLRSQTGGLFLERFAIEGNNIGYQSITNNSEEWSCSVIDDD